MQSILAVDDSPSMRKMVSFTLTGAGYHVVEAVDGQDALEKAEAHDIHLVLADPEHAARWRGPRASCAA
jgi:two-component system chemotaxis response regulator CheY